MCGREITDDIDEVKAFIGTNTQNLFVLADVGGNTGTNIMKISQGLSSIVIGVVSILFEYEGKVRKK